MTDEPAGGEHGATACAVEVLGTTLVAIPATASSMVSLASTAGGSQPEDGVFYVSARARSAWAR